MLILSRSAFAQTLPPPDQAGFEHVVVVMMENRSFDHLFGWLQGENVQQALTYRETNGTSHSTHYLPPDYQGCGFLDPGHSYTDGRVQFHNGACDGFLFDGSDSSTSNPSQANDVFAIGYYNQSDLPFLGVAGPAFTIRNRAAVNPDSLFDGYALGEVARLVDVATEHDGKMIGEQLQRDHS